MRAIVVDEFGPPERLRVADVPPPVPGPGEVLVETHAAPVNYVDMLVVAGTYQFLPPFPFIPGKGPAGIVAALGPGVTTLRVGDGRDRRLCRSGRGCRRPVPPSATAHDLCRGGLGRRRLRHLVGRVAR